MSNLRKSVKGSTGNWIDMQKDTFGNWVNANLQQRNLSIENLEEGFADGVNLINLYEIISKKNVGKYSKQPKFHNQCMENVSIVLKAAEADGVKIVSIDSDHIVNGNIKMILGLLWQFILRYHIVGADDKSVKIALKKLLLIWLQHAIPERRIKNLTTDWNDGIALCNLINVLQPGLCPEYNLLDRNNSVENVAKGMRLAEEKFNIPQIISPHHMANPSVDELSMMTYLSYFTQDNGVGEKWTLELVNWWNGGNHTVDNFNTDWIDGRALGSLVKGFAPGLNIDYRDDGDDVNNCRNAMKIAEECLNVPSIITPEEMANPHIPELAVMAYTVQFTKAKLSNGYLPPMADPSYAGAFSASGSGLSEPQVGEENEISVRCEQNFPFDDLQMSVTDPNHRQVPVTFEDKSPRLRLYKYTPEQQGPHNVQITYKNQNIPNTPVVVNPKNSLAKIKIHSFEGGVTDEPVEFIVDADSNDAHVTAEAILPDGTRQPCDVKDAGNGKHKVRFTPRGTGSHSVSIAVNGKTLPGEPIQIPVEKKPEQEELIAYEYNEDRHLYAELYERIGIAVDTQNSGDGSLTAKTRGPHGNQVSTDVDEEEEGSYTVSFTPQEIGEYKTNVFWNEKEIQGSPFVVWVSDPTKIVSSGNGLKQARVKEETHFDVETKGAGPGDLESYIEHDGHRKDVQVVKKNETLYDCAFRADNVGVHNVFVNYNESPVKGSPFPVKVGDPDEVVIIPESETVAETTKEYACKVKLTEHAGDGDVVSKVTDSDGELVPSHVRHMNDASREIAFEPRKPGRHEMNIYYVGHLLDGCPHYIDVKQGTPLRRSDPSKVYVSGSGIREGAVNELSSIKVDAREAGPGHLSTTVHGVRNDVIAGIRDNNDGTYDVTYTPQVPGAYVVDVKWDNEHVQGSPYKVTVENKPHPESVVVGGEGIKEGTAGQPVTFHLDGRNAGPGQLSCRCRAPSGKMTYVLISDNKDGTYTVDLNASEPGLHTVEVEWDGQPIPGSPFLVRIMQAPDMKKVRAFGPGLESGVVGAFNGTFKVDSKGAGPGTMKVRIHGPKGAFKVEMYRDNPKDRSIHVRYNPSEPGLYTANIYWSDEHIVGSPFEIFLAKNDLELQEWKRKAERSANGY